jgi:hypothetical protein
MRFPSTGPVATASWRLSLRGSALPAEGLSCLQASRVITGLRLSWLNNAVAAEV